MAAGIARRHWPDLVAAAYACAYAAWLLARTPGTPEAIAVGEIAFYPLGLAVAWAYWRNARFEGLDRRTRAAWQLLAASAALMWLSGTAWTLYLRLRGPADVPPWVDQLEYVQNLCLIAGCIAFPNTSPLRRSGGRYLVDLALTVVAGFVLALAFVVRVADRTDGVAILPLDVAGAAADWLQFVVLSIGFARKRDGRVRNSMGWLLGAQLAYLLANYAYNATPAYHPGDAVDGLWFAAWVLRWTAARSAWRSYARSGTAERAISPATLAYRSSLFAYVVVAATFLLVLVQLITDRRHIEITVFSAAVMASILLVRQLAEMRENRRLFAEQLSQQARFRALVQQSSDVLLVVDGGGVVTWVSASAPRVFGAPSPVHPGVLLGAVIQPAEGSSLAPVFEHREAHARPLQARIRVASGEWRDLEIAWNDLRADEHVGGIVLSCRDVTERNELDRRLQHAQKLDAVGHLAGGLAHDFNNVLTVIRGYTELLRADLPPESAASDDLRHMEQAVDRAAAVTRKLLAFSRRQPVQPVVLDLNRVVRGLQPIFRQLLADGAEVELALAPDLWPVRADPGQLEQVIINLATNARDAMPEGGRLIVQTANETVTPDSSALVPAGAYTTLTLADTGCGMDEATQARIFEPFFSTKPKDRGMGLGLAMVHGIVTAAGGSIDVRSSPGAGAVFTIRLPRSVEAAAPLAAPDERPARTARAVTVLVVDDEPGVRDVARRFLESRGYAVVEAAGGREAIDVLDDRVRRVDVVLTDMIMPGTSGREVVAHARTARPGVPVVVMTGYAGEERDAAGSSDVAAVVGKPFSAGVLVRASAAALAAREPRD
jgi:PAS domain S-box-containing protein